MQKNEPKFYCKNCDYVCSRKFLWTQHCATQKHIRKHMETPTQPLHIGQKKYAPNITSGGNEHVCECGKSYIYRGGLWKHRQNCAYVKNIANTTNVSAKPNTVPNENVKLEKENNDLKNLVQKMLAGIDNDAKTRNKMMGQLEQQNRIIQDMIPKLGNNNNNRFNINVFLNEDCRDAINMSEFIDSLHVKLTDLQYTQNNGLIEGISSVLVDGLQQLDMCQRPIHCTDVKREVLYIKDNDAWGRQNTKEHLRNAIVDVANKQRKAIAEWEKQNPAWASTEKGKEKYIQLVQSVMTDINAPQMENRIIKNIAKETVIQKQPNKDA